MVTVDKFLACFLVLFVSALWLKKSRSTQFSTTRDAYPTSQQERGSGSEQHRHSCSHCFRIAIRIPDSYAQNSNDDILFHLPHTVADIRKAAAEGCPLLADLMDGHKRSNDLKLRLHVFFAIFDSQSALHAFTGCKSLRQRALYFLRCLSSRPFHLRFGRLSEEAGSTLYARFLFSAWKSFELDVTASWDDNASRFIPERPLNINVVSSETFRQARAWLMNCIEGHSASQSHPKCQILRADRSRAPSRLIEVTQLSDGSYHPRIWTNNRETQLQWACLSYCWGGDQSAKTTRATLAAREKHLPFSDLPKTLQDALIVTFHLGLRYIWIDALCIVQDDPDDVQREIASMPDIYTMGVCTISASRAQNSREGFLGRHLLRSCTTLPVQCPDGKPGRIKLTYRGAEYESNGEPIHNRAWCFQERLLSPRILDFNSTQLRWTCPSAVEVDGGRSTMTTYAQEHLSHWYNSSLHGDELTTRWRDIVFNYTRRDLTFAGDKLLAISAVAARFNSINRDEYLAGLWRRNLSQELGWHSGRPKYHRPDEFVAPSWSWASIRDWANWNVDKGEAMEENDTETLDVFETVDYNVTLVHATSPFGAVKDGHLLLNSQSRGGIWYPKRGEVVLTSKTADLVFTQYREALEATQSHKETHFLGWVFPDTLTEAATDTSGEGIGVQCLKIAGRTEKKGTRCLLLVPTDDSQSAYRSYRRIAFFEMGDAFYRYDPPIRKDFFEDIERQVIKLV